MERTAGLIVHALLLERDIIADDVDDVGGGIYPVYGGPVNHEDKDSEYFRMLDRVAAAI